MDNVCEPSSSVDSDRTDQNSLIQKSYPLLSLWHSPLTLEELKILDTYLARIDSHHPEQRWVRFSKGELEALLEVKRLRTDVLKERLRNLCIVVTLEDPQAPNGFRAITLFEQMLCTKDDDGLWQIDLQCTPSAMRYIFNIDNIGYLKYRLWAVLHLRSRYSYVLFLYIERNSFRKEWEISLNELRHILRCDTESSYDEFRRFNDRVLKRARNEIQEKTPCRFSYQTVKLGRRVQAIHFHYEGGISNSPLLEKPVEATVGDQPIVSNSRREAISFLQSACIRNGKPEFSARETAQILEILRVIPPTHMPAYTPGGNPLFAMYHYLSERYAAMDRLDADGNIRNRFAYLVCMLKQDAGIET